MLRPPPTRALPQSRHSEQGAFARLSAKNLLFTLASQTPILLWRVAGGDPSAPLRMTRKKKIFFARNEVAPTPEPSKCLAEPHPSAFFILTDPRTLAVISTGRNYPPILLYRLLLDVLFKLYLSFICSGEISALEKEAEISPLHTGLY